MKDTEREAYEYANAQPINLFKALAGFLEQEVPTIHKGTSGHNYSYADLPTIFEVINPLLKKWGLGFTQLLEGDSILTIIFHVESGETIQSMTDIPKVEMRQMNAYQSFGSGVTYYRRYALSSALGLVTDKDTDAGGTAKPMINAKDFNKYVEGVKNGKSTKENLVKFCNDFTLTEEQKTIISEL